MITPVLHTLATLLEFLAATIDPNIYQSDETLAAAFHAFDKVRLRNTSVGREREDIGTGAESDDR